MCLSSACALEQAQKQTSARRESPGDTGLAFLPQGLEGEWAFSSPDAASCPHCHGLQAPDGHPLRVWKASTEVAAPPAVVLHRILRERALWDEDLLRAQVLEALMPGVELYHYVTDSMAPHPCRDFVVLR